MNFFADLSQGMTAQRDVNDRKRSELARAFQEFRSANPHATLQEMQQYIDAQTGGRNYLMRGAPSGAVLQSIADANAQAKKQSDTNARLSQMQEQSRVMDMINDAATRALLDSNGDISKAQEAVRMQMGGDFGTIDPTSIFTPERWQRIQQDEIARNYDAAKTWIYDSVDDKDEITVSPKDVSKYFGVPEAVAEGILFRAKEERKREGEARQAERDKELRLRRKDALDFLTTELEKNPDRDPSEALGYFFGVDPSELPPEWVGAVKADSQKNLDRKEEDYQRQKDATISQGKRELMTALSTDADIRAALMAGDRDAAIMGMMAYAETFPEEVRAELTGTWLEQQIARTLSSMQQAQRLTVSQARAEASTKAVEYGKEFRDQVGQRVQGAIEAKTLTSPVQGMVAQTLANEYALEDRHILAIEQLAQDNPSMGVAELHSAAKSLLDSAGTPKLADAVTQAQEQFKRSQGVENPMTFGEWEQMVASDVTEDRAVADQKFQEIVALPDPSVRAERLEALAAAAIATHEHFKAAVKADQDNSVAFLTYGTERWDAARAAKQVEAHRLMTEAAVKKIEAAQASAARQVEALGKAQVTTPAAGGDGSRSQLSNAIGGINTSLAQTGQLNATRDDHRSYGLFGRALMPQDKFAANRYMTQFMDYPGVEDMLRSDPAMLDAFVADEWGFLKSTQDPKLRAVIDKLGPLPEWYYQQRQ